MTDFAQIKICHFTTLFFFFSALSFRNQIPALIEDSSLFARPVLTMHTNTTIPLLTPPFPTCVLAAQAPLIPGLSDNVFAIILPTIVYAIAGGFFHLLDIYNLFDDYRIHPSEDELKRNHVTKWQCLQTVVRYHIIQISIGLALNYGNGPTMVGYESCQVHRAAGMIRRARHLVPLALNAMGIDANRLAIATESTSAGLAQVLAGDYLSSGKASQHTGLNTVELSLAKVFLFFGVPAFQYLVALTVVDTWIYFTHRLCHVNKTLYRKSLHFEAKPITCTLNLFTPQVSSTPNTTASTSHTRTGPFMLTGSRRYSSTYSASSWRER